MIKILDGLSIGKKTVGLVTLLLAVMLGISIYSFYRVKTVSDEIIDVDEWIVPIDDSISAIELHSLIEEVHIQRALRLYEAKPIHQTAIAKELKFFQDRSKQISEEITKTTAFSNEALKNVKILEDGIAIAEFKALLEGFENQHRQYEALALKTLDSFKKGDIQTATLLESQLDAEEDNLDQLAERMRNRVAEFTEQRSRQVSLDEQNIIWLSLENLVIASIAFTLGVLITWIIARRLVTSVRQILSSADTITQGDLNVSVPVQSKDEIGMLATSFNLMAQELRNKELVKSKFSQYIDPRVVETLLAQDDAVMSNGDRQVMTVFFSDIVGFSAIAEILTPFGLVKLINKYLTLASEPILQHKGVIDKYIGDAVMSFWGPPFTDPSEHAKLACLASLAQFEQLEKLEAALPELLGFRQGLPKINIRIGLATGELVIGNIGSNISKSFTVVGDTVNLASRIESANKQYGTRILISEETHEQVQDDFETREIDHIIVAGKTQPVRIFELLAIKGQLEQPVIELRTRFKQGLQDYRDRNWSSAIASFTAALEINPADRPSKIFLDRIHILKDAPPPTHWDGVWHMATK